MSDHKPPKCPMCGRERLQKFRPFCSKRCADLDLARWLGGVYSLPATEPSDNFGDFESDPEFFVPEPDNDR